MKELDKALIAAQELKSLERLQRARRADVSEAIRTMKQDIRVAEKMIDSLDDVLEKSTMRYRYLLGYPWQDIAMIMQCDLSTCFRRHNRALKHLEDYDK